MKRFILLALSLMIGASAIWAVPAKRGVKRTLTLKDGTQIEATLTGDEHVHYYLTADQRAIQKIDDEYQFVNRQALVREHARKLKARNAERAARRVGTAPESGYHGQKRGLVILVEFSDVKFTYDQATFNDYFNKVGYNQDGMHGSVHDYFLEQSYGEFDLEFDVVGPVSMTRTAAYYSDEKNSSRVPDLVYDACKKVDADVNFKTYDWDNDGIVDQVYVIYAGYGAAQGAENTIWPHEWTLAGGTNGTYMTGERNMVSTYGISCELKGDGKTSTGILDGIGTACHEFSHCLGLPDFYDTSDDGSNFGMNVWSLMDYGCYNDNGCTPSGYTAYERWFGGWLTPTELNSSQQVVNIPAIEDEPVAYIIYNDNEKNEYYLLANHQQKGFDTAQYGHGLLVNHVDYDASVWGENTVNNDAEHQRMTIIPADNKFGGYGRDNDGDPFPGSSGNDALTDDTKPAASLYNANTDGKTLMGKPITDIMEANGLITFNFMGGVTVDAPVIAEATNITETSFTANWNAVVGAVEYTLELTTEEVSSSDPYDNVIFSESFANFESEIASTRTDLSDKLDEYTNLPGWTGSKLYRSPYLLRVGNNTEEGYIVSPVFEQPSKEALSIAISPAGISGNTGNMELRLILASTGQYAPANITEIPSVTEGVYTYLLSTPWTYGAFQIGVYSETPGVYLQGLMAFDGEYTWDDFDVKAERSFNIPGKHNTNTTRLLNEGSLSWYAPDGQPIASPIRKAKKSATYYNTTNTYYDFANLPPAIYTYRVRVTTSEGISPWSEEMTVDLTTGIQQVQTEKSIANGDIYDLSGRKVSQPKHGIYIMNGKKILVK